MFALPHATLGAALALGLVSAALPGAAARAETLTQLVDAASRRMPELAAIQARRVAAAARHAAAGSITPGPPVLGGRYITDQVIRNRNARELEVSISTPLWLPGEGTASQHAAAAEIARLAAQEAALRLKVAGLVREAAAAVALARSDLQTGEQRLRDARLLEGDVARRVKARELAETDLLTAQADRIAAEAELHERRGALGQARIGLAGITGIKVGDVVLNEPEPSAAPTLDPRLEEARTALDVARANLDLVTTQSRENPEVGLVGRRSRDMNGVQWNNSLGVELRIPLGGTARNAPRQGAARAEMADAVATHGNQQRDIETDRRRARSVYDTAIAQRGLARDRAAVLVRQRDLTERSFRQGQAALPDLIRVRALAVEAGGASSRAAIAVLLARGRLNQALGVMP